ncbi:MAG: hypothetical protein QXJ14_02280 [Candidatus Aenigmatarchaeota archaeon]
MVNIHYKFKSIIPKTSMNPDKEIVIKIFATKTYKIITSEPQEFYVKNNPINLPTYLMWGAYVCLNKFSYFGKSIDTEKLARKRCNLFFYKFGIGVPKFI